MLIFFLLLSFNATILFAETEEFLMLCNGERKFINLKEKGLSVIESESILLMIKKNSLKYIGLNSGRVLTFSNKEYSSTKRPPHEDIKITEKYKYTPKIIKASLKIADYGNSAQSSINFFSLDVNLLTGELNETEFIRNKKTNLKSMSNNFQALCTR